MKAKIRTGYIPILRKSHVHKEKQQTNKDIVRKELKGITKW